MNQDQLLSSVGREGKWTAFWRPCPCVLGLWWSVTSQVKHSLYFTEVWKPPNSCLIFLYQRQKDDAFNVLVSPYWWCHSLYKWGSLEDVFMTYSSSSWEKEGGFCAILKERMRFLRKFWEKECDLWENPDIKKECFWRILRVQIKFLRKFWQKKFSEGNLTERWMFLRLFWERESSFWGNIDRNMYVFEIILTERRMILKEFAQTEGRFWWNSDRKKDDSEGIFTDRRTFLMEFWQKEGWFWRNFHRQKEVSDGFLIERRIILKELS